MDYLTTHISLQKYEEVERLEAYAKAKIAKGLEDIADSRTVSEEEFLAEIEARLHPPYPR